MIDLDISRIAEKLTRSRVISVNLISGGANNRTYCVTTSDRRYALKSYLRQDVDPRDRLEVEFGAIKFLNHHGELAVPSGIACDRRAGFALYDWLDGEKITDPGERDIGAALGFVKRLKSLSYEQAALELPLASEACLSAQELIKQIQDRLSRLQGVSEAHQRLKDFLKQDVVPLFLDFRDHALSQYDDRKWLVEREIDKDFRTLSPSDFGFHNALKTIDGNVFFVDLEYFGWDDPVRLVADFLLHPGMQLNDDLLRLFANEAFQIFCDDENFIDRFDLLYPLIGLRWVLIILNEFLPERQERRRFANEADPKQAKERQLVKASGMLETLRKQGRHSPYGHC